MVVINWLSITMNIKDYTNMYYSVHVVKHTVEGRHIIVTSCANISMVQ